MVDSTEATESEFVTAELVEQSETKKLAVVDPGKYEETDWGKRLTLGVNMDGKVKRWRMNKETAGYMQALGKDTIDWVGKVVSLSVELRSGKKSVIGKPADIVQQPPIQQEQIDDDQPHQAPIA